MNLGATIISDLEILLAKVQLILEILIIEVNDTIEKRIQAGIMTITTKDMVGQDQRRESEETEVEAKAVIGIESILEDLGLDQDLESKEIVALAGVQIEVKV